MTVSLLNQGRIDERGRWRERLTDREKESMRFYESMGKMPVDAAIRTLTNLFLIKAVDKKIIVDGGHH